MSWLFTPAAAVTKKKAFTLNQGCIWSVLCTEKLKKHLFLLNYDSGGICSSCDSPSLVRFESPPSRRSCGAAVQEDFLLTFCSSRSLVIAVWETGGAWRGDMRRCTTLHSRQEKHCCCRLCFLIVYLPHSSSLSLSWRKDTLFFLPSPPSFPQAYFRWCVFSFFISVFFIFFYHRSNLQLSLFPICYLQD